MVLSKSNHNTANSRCKGLRRNLYTLLSRPTKVTTSSGMEDSVTLWAWTLFGLFIPSSLFKINLPPSFPSFLPPPSLPPFFPPYLTSIFLPSFCFHSLVFSILVSHFFSQTDNVSVGINLKQTLLASHAAHEGLSYKTKEPLTDLFCIIPSEVQASERQEPT